MEHHRVFCSGDDGEFEQGIGKARGGAYTSEVMKRTQPHSPGKGARYVPDREDGEHTGGALAADRRVLIVDDEEDFAESLADILHSRGYDVYVTHGPAGALKALDNSRPHCALIDIRLGTANGIDLLTRLKMKSPEMPCILMTAYASTDSAIEALHRGAYDYLPKPLEANELLATLDRCFSMVNLMEQRDAANRALRIQSEELAEVNARLRRMVESARALASCRDLEELSRNLLEEFASVLGAEGGSIYTVHDSGLGLVHCLGEGAVPGWIDFPLPARSVFDRVLRIREAVLVEDIGGEDLSPSGGGRYRDGSLFALPLLDREGKVLAAISLHNKKQPPFMPQDREVGQVMLSLTSEILRSQQVTDRIRTSLEEKDVLLREIHHRVKNNLQVISGLLDLQARNVGDDQARHIYENSQTRINTMALIHEKIFQTKDLTSIPFGGFVEDLTGNLMKVYGRQSGHIRLDLEVEDVKLAVDTAVPCGLIINELCTNALEHAFPDDRPGVIRVDFAEVESGVFRLTVSDDGVGLPPGFELCRAGSMGLQLVSILSEQLGSETTVTCDGGTSFTFRFREYLEAGTVMY